MKFRIIGTLGLGFGLVVGAAFPGGSQGTARAATSLASLSLKKGDVPAAYKQTVGSAQSAQSAAKNIKVSVAALRSKGWVSSYESQFVKSGTKTNSEISGSVDQFKSAGGAIWELNQGLQILRKQYRSSKTFSVSGIGQRAVGISTAGKIGKTPFTLVFVAFVRSSYVGAAGIVLAGPGTVSASEAERYANIIDGRVKNA